MLRNILKIVALGAFIVLASANGAISQSSQSVTDATTTTPQSIEKLISRLSVDEIQTLSQLLEQLADEKQTAVIAGKREKELLESLKEGWESYKKYLWENITGIPELLSGLVKAIAAIFGREDLSSSLYFIAVMLAILAAGAGGEFLVTRQTRSLHERISHTDSSSIAETIKALSLRFLLEVAGIVVFGLITYQLAARIFQSSIDEFIAIRLIILVILPIRAMSAILRFLLAPYQPSLRLVSANDWTARFIHRHFVILTALVGIALFLLHIMIRQDISGGVTLRFWVGLAVYLGIIYVTWRARNGLASIIKGEDEDVTPGLERMAHWWPYISIAVILIQYFAAQISLATGSNFLSPTTAITIILVIVMAPFLDTGLRGVVKNLVPSVGEEGSVAQAAHLNTKLSYARIGRVVLVTILVLLIFRLWGVSFQSLAAASVGAQLAANVLGAITVLVVGYIVWEIVNLWINRQLLKDAPISAGGPTPGSEEGLGAGESRLATILPLLRITLMVAIAIVTVLLALSQLGLNITPLLAGAGVFGLAIGFGAQTLVKDVVSGVFFLIDDAFRMGEFIDIGGTMGTVEKISVRSLQLRHPNGPVHIVPYGEIPKLTNNSRDYVIMKLKFTVPFDTDIEKVRKLFKKIGQEMMQNPEHAANFIQPFKSQGVSDVDDVGIVVRGKFMTKPGAQWMIRKEIYARVQKAFEENGISFARKEVRVQIPGLDDNDDLDEKQKEEISRAAVTAASVAVDDSANTKPKKQDDVM